MENGANLYVQEAGTGEQIKVPITSSTLFDLQDCVGSGWPGLRKSIIRGHNIGSAVTDEQWNNIKNGSFQNLFLGDFWKIGNINWQIVDFDYFMYVGETDFVSKHHIVIMPMSTLYQRKMKDTLDISGGYVNTDMHKTGLDQAKSMIYSAFGSDHILPVKGLLSNSINSDKTGISGAIFSDISIELPTEAMCSGVLNQSTKKVVVGNHDTESFNQLLLPAISISSFFGRSNFWTRDYVGGDGYAAFDWKRISMFPTITNTIGVRPVFAIYAP